MSMLHRRTLQVLQWLYHTPSPHLCLRLCVSLYGEYQGRMQFCSLHALQSAPIVASTLMSGNLQEDIAEHEDTREEFICYQSLTSRTAAALCPAFVPDLTNIHFLLLAAGVQVPEARGVLQLRADVLGAEEALHIQCFNLLPNVVSRSAQRPHKHILLCSGSAFMLQQHYFCTAMTLRFLEAEQVGDAIGTQARLGAALEEAALWPQTCPAPVKQSR